MFRWYLTYMCMDDRVIASSLFHVHIMTKPTTPCLLPAVSPSANGYHKASLNGKTVLKHRLEYCRANNVTLESIKDKIVMHTCDNPSCVTPLHLVLGTQRENSLDMHNKGRANLVIRAKGENVNTAKLTAADVRDIIINTPFKTTKSWAKLHGVANSTILAIQSGRTWKHIHKELTMTT